MADKSKIQWTDATWNIAVGCSKVDADCKYCYMYRQSLNGTRYKPDQVIKTKTVFNFPLKWFKQYSDCWHGKPLIFTSSLTDVFHPECDWFRAEMWAIIKRCPQYIFQILTKRPERINDCLPDDWGTGYENVWLGTSVGSNEGMHRAVTLSKVDAHVKFLSLEPLHGPIHLTEASIHIESLAEDFYILPAFDWVIVGGESGNENGKYKYRECKIEWIEKIVKDCKNNLIPVFVKQMGTHLAKQLKLSDRHGGDINEFPEGLQVREFPNIKQ